MKNKFIVGLLGLLIVTTNALSPVTVHAAEASTEGPQWLDEIEESPELDEFIRQAKEFEAAHAEEAERLYQEGQAEWAATHGEETSDSTTTEQVANSGSAPANTDNSQNVTTEQNQTAVTYNANSNDASHETSTDNSVPDVSESKIVKKDKTDKEDVVKKNVTVESNENKKEAIVTDGADDSDDTDAAEEITSPKKDDSPDKKSGPIVVKFFKKVGDSFKCVATAFENLWDHAIAWFLGK